MTPSNRPGRSGRRHIRGTTFRVNGRRTTLRLEADFIRALREIARREGLTPSGLVTRIDKRRDPATQGLTSSVRIYVVQYYRKLARQRRPENAAGRA